MNSFKGFRIAARGLVQENNKILFVSDEGEFWYLPGGRLEPNETLEDCVEREVYEETGLQVKVGSLLYVVEYLDRKDNIHKIHFIFDTKVIKGTLSENWNDAGGCVQHRRFLGIEEIQQNKKIIPQFLSRFSFDELFVKKQEVYQGAQYSHGFSVLEDVS